MGQYLIRFKFIKVEIPCIVHDEKNGGGNNTKIIVLSVKMIKWSFYKL